MTHYINPRWTDGKGNYFIVVKTETIDNQEWIFYTKEGSNLNFSCLKEAFLSRFINQP